MYHQQTEASLNEDINNVVELAKTFARSCTLGGNRHKCYMSQFGSSYPVMLNDVRTSHDEVEMCSNRSSITASVMLVEHFGLIINEKYLREALLSVYSSIK